MAKAKAKVKGPNYFSYLIAYIDAEHIDKVDRELAKYQEYNEVEAIIPTIKVLKKTFKGKQQFEHVPLLFNYGFFKIPRKFATSGNYLSQMQKDISCLYAWVKDTAKILNEQPEYKTVEGKKIYQYTNLDISVATIAGPHEIAHLLSDSFSFSDHGAEELKNIPIGTEITLKGYPWDDIRAKILEVDYNRKEVKVEINIFSGTMPATVSFENVIFSMYHRNQHDENYNPESRLDDMEQRKQDKLIFKNLSTHGNK